MARIRTIHDGGTCLRITGKLTAGDMGRLERACAKALMCKRLRLELDLRQVTWMDLTARAVIELLERRGATVIRRPFMTMTRCE